MNTRIGVGVIEIALAALAFLLFIGWLNGNKRVAAAIGSAIAAALGIAFIGSMFYLVPARRVSSVRAFVDSEHRQKHEQRGREIDGPRSLDKRERVALPDTLPLAGQASPEAASPEAANPEAASPEAASPSPPDPQSPASAAPASQTQPPAQETAPPPQEPPPAVESTVTVTPATPPASPPPAPAPPVNVRPNWLESAAWDEKGAHFRTVTSDRWRDTTAESEADRRTLVSLALHEYIKIYIDDQSDSVENPLPAVQETDLVETQYIEPSEEFNARNPSSLPLSEDVPAGMYRLHLKLRFSERFRRELPRLVAEQRDRQSSLESQWLVAGRVRGVGTVAAILLGVLATAFGYLHLDTLTKGYYTGRLQLAAAAAILGLVALALTMLT